MVQLGFVDIYCSFWDLKIEFKGYLRKNTYSWRPLKIFYATDSGQEPDDFILVFEVMHTAKQPHVTSLRFGVKAFIL